MTYYIIDVVVSFFTNQVKLLHQKSMEFEQSLVEKEAQWEAERLELLDRHKQVRKWDYLI